MKKPDVGTTFHPGHEDLAAFIEGSAGEIDKARVQAHLACCESCLEAHDYAVQYRGRPEEIQSDLAPSRLALRTAKAIASRDYQRAHYDRRGRRGWMVRIGPVGRIAVVGAVVAVFAAAVYFLRPISIGRGFDPHSGALSPVTDAIVAASERGPLVLPGIEDALGSKALRFRSGPVPVTPALEKSLAKLAEAYNRGKLLIDEAQWLISGYVACGQLERAQSYLEGARARYADDVDLAVLEGVLAYHNGELGAAGQRFEWVLERDPNNRVALYNLASVKKESGDPEGARVLLRRMSEMAPDSPLGRRAAEAAGR